MNKDIIATPLLEIISTNVLNWMENILFERYGAKFRLVQSRHEQIRLVLLDEHRRSIDFDVQRSFYLAGEPKFKCGSWDASAEGWHSSMGLPIPTPGSDELVTTVIKRKSNGYRIHYDILGLVYWMLSRQEEVGREDLDEHDRFPGRASHAFKFNYLKRPVVDEWLHILGQVIKKNWPNTELKKHSFRIEVSHDVDLPSAYAFKSWMTISRILVGHIVKRRNLSEFYKTLLIRFNSKYKIHHSDPANTFDYIMKLSEESNLVSTFYFICGKTSQRYDSDYDISHYLPIRSLLREVHRRGHKIGLHPSYNTYRDSWALKREADTLKRVCSEEGVLQEEWGARMHYLRWKHPYTLIGLQNAQLDNDCTLGYADLPGFRCGTCFEYPGCDPIEKEILSIRIRPLIAMECTIMSKSYLGMGTGTEALNEFLQLKNACAKMGGVFTLLWHNSQLESPEKRRIYESVLNKVL